MPLSETAASVPSRRGERPPESAGEPWDAGDGFFRDRRLADLEAGHGLTVRSWGDMRCSRNRRSALARAGAPEPDARVLRQVHGTGISILRREGAPDGSPPHADGWITDRPGAVVAVQVADCLPIWIWHRSGRAAGVFHAGWRGLAAGLPREAVAGFGRSFGLKPMDLEASVGPHAGACCYRVGPEVARQFRLESLVRRGGDVRLDLGAEARAQLLESGLAPAAVSVAGACTICRPELFYSYRREGRTGEMLAFLWLGA